jgi:hypothetical protein
MLVIMGELHWERAIWQEQKKSKWIFEERLSDEDGG